MSRKQLTHFQRHLIVAITLASSFLSVLMQFLLITAFPKIMQDFSINSTKVQWLTTGFMVTITIFIPITAYFIDTFKTRTLMISAMSLFFIGTLIGYLAPTFSVLLIGRIFQGIGSGIMIPLMQTILFLVYPRNKRGMAMGLAGMVTNVAPAIGPPLSGMLIEYFAWRYLFLLTLPIAGVILLLVILFMKNVTEQRESRTDLMSILLATIGFGGTLYGFNKVYEIGISHPLTMISLIGGLLALVLFSLRQLRMELPILQLRVLKIPVFVVTSILSIIALSLLISVETILPLYVQNAQQLSAYYAGLVVMPGAFTLALGSYFGGKLYDRYGGKIISIAGFIIVSISLVFYYFVLTLDTPFYIPTLLFAVAMAGFALVSMPVITAGINALPDELIPHGTSVINTIRQFGGTIGLTFIISFISRTEKGNAIFEPSSYLAGVKTAFLVSLILSLVGLGLSFLIQEEDGIVLKP